MSRKVFFICAADDPERDAWIAAIQASSTLKRAGSSAASAAEADADALDNATDPRSVRNQVSGADGSVALGDFELLKVIGRGTYGKVMQVRLKTTREVLAMKVLKKEAVIRRNQVVHTKTETHVLKQIRHPFLTRMHFAFQSEGKLYMVLNYLQGAEIKLDVFGVDFDGDSARARAKTVTKQTTTMTTMAATVTTATVATTIVKAAAK